MNSSQTPLKVTPVHDPAWELGADFIEVAGWQVPQVFSTVEKELITARQHVGLADGSASGKILVQGEEAESVLQGTWAIPSLASGQGVRIESKGIYRLRKDQIFIHLDPGTEEVAKEELTKAAEGSSGLVTISDVTHGLADLLLIGPQGNELLSRLCGLDFHPNEFPNLSAKQSSVAKTRQLILRHDVYLQAGSSVQAFSIIGARSLAPYLWRTILEAGHDLDITPIGWSALEKLGAEIK